jgi:hypothetical protein
MNDDSAINRNIWVISDTHFGHANILNFTDSNTGAKVRTFYDMYEMDEHMVDRWNKTVKDEDIVYHLGDVYFDSGHTVLPRLKGRKRLILGNHDNAKSPHLQNHFQKISMWRMFPEFGLLLTHVPVHPSSLRVYAREGDVDPVHKTFLNLHGHIHQNPSPEGPYRNMSVEAIDYTPINIEELRIK